MSFVNILAQHRSTTGGNGGNTPNPGDWAPRTINHIAFLYGLPAGVTVSLDNGRLKIEGSGIVLQVRVRVRGNSFNSEHQARLVNETTGQEWESDTAANAWTGGSDVTRDNSASHILTKPFSLTGVALLRVDHHIGQSFGDGSDFGISTNNGIPDVWIDLEITVADEVQNPPG